MTPRELLVVDDERVFHLEQDGRPSGGQVGSLVAACVTWPWVRNFADVFAASGRATGGTMAGGDANDLARFEIS